MLGQGNIKKLGNAIIQKYKIQNKYVWQNGSDKIQC
jgi:hypothetical protein